MQIQSFLHIFDVVIVQVSTTAMTPTSTGAPPKSARELTTASTSAAMPMPRALAARERLPLLRRQRRRKIKRSGRRRKTRRRVARLRRLRPPKQLKPAAPKRPKTNGDLRRTMVTIGPRSGRGWFSSNSCLEDLLSMVHHPLCQKIKYFGSVK